MVFRGDRQLIGADLVRGIAVGGDPVGADDHPLHRTGLHQMRRGGIGDQLGRDAVAHQLPHGQPRALLPRPGFAGIDMVDPAHRHASADHAQGRAETGGRQRTGIAVGQYAGVCANQRSAQLAHLAIGGQILVLDRLRFTHQRRGIGTGRDALFHPVQRPHQIHRCRARGTQRGQHLVEWFALFRCQRHTPRGGDADRRRAAHGEILDRLGDLAAVGTVDPAFLTRQQPLIEQSQMITLPLHGTNAVVTVVIHGYVFTAQSNGCQLSDRAVGSRRLRHDQPHDQVDQDARSAEQGQHDPGNPHQGRVPAVVLGNPRADTGQLPVVARTVQTFLHAKDLEGKVVSLSHSATDG